MSPRYDVAARLGEGESAVEHTEAYVRACQALGYQQPDLTAHPSQVRDWYETEAGLDLEVLNGDVDELRAAVTAVEEALWVQRMQVTELAVAWRGSGAEAATRFLRQHCDAAAQVVAQVRAAAEHCAALRDGVWQAVDGKVATTVAIDERTAAERSSWLAAAQAVTAGSADRSTAEVVVHRHVMPYVDNDIRNDWLAAVSSANASVAASYDAAIHALASTRDVSFDVPGDLGPSWQPAVDDRPVVNAAPALSLPASPPLTVPAAAPAPPTPSPIPDTSPEEPADAPATPLDDAAGLSSGASGLGGVTGGIGGVLGSIVDSIGGLIGSLTGGLGGNAQDDPLGLDDADDADDPLADEADKPDDAPGPAASDDVMPEVPVAESSSTPDEVAADPVAQHVEPAPEAPPPEQPSADAATPTTDRSTPCEIAEDQLPQVGQ